MAKIWENKNIIQNSTTCKHRIVNFETGEVIESDSIRPLVFVIKRWIVNGTDRQMLTARSYSYGVASYLMKVAYLWSIDKCDCCNKQVKKKDLKFHIDSYGNYMMSECKECLS